MIGLPEKLSREVERIAVLRSADTLLLQSGIVPLGLLGDQSRRIFAMSEALEHAHVTAGAGTAAAMNEAVRRLRGFHP
jgi:hypothetical protein